MGSPHPPDSSPQSWAPWPGQTPATDLPTSSSFGVPGACVLLLLREPGRCLHWGRGPVSRLGLLCHKELLKAPSFPLNQVYREAQIGASEAPGGRGDWPGPGCSHLKALFCVLLLEFLLSHVEAGQWGWDPGGSGPAPSPPPPSLTLTLICGGGGGRSEKAHPRVRRYARDGRTF